MSESFLHASGLVEWRPDAKTTERVTARGGYVISGGQLCTACLVGTWPMSMFRQSQTLCETCTSLDGEVTRRAGPARLTSAGRPASRVIRAGGLDDLNDPDWDPVRRARALRAEKLAQVFVHARGLGIVLLEEREPGQAPHEVIDYDDLRRHDLIPDDMPTRIRRFADWLQVLEPQAYEQRTEALAQVGSLSRMLVEEARTRRRARSRAELDRAFQDAQRVPQTVISAVAGVLRARRRTE